jgi:hypothetical protein
MKRGQGSVVQTYNALCRAHWFAFPLAKEGVTLNFKLYFRNTSDANQSINP